MLRALEDTEGALTTYSKALEREASLQEAARASSEAAGLASVRYEEGVSDFLLVLDAERTSFEGGAAGGDRESEQALLARAQINF